VLFLHEPVTVRLLGAGLAVACGIALLSWTRNGGTRNWPWAALALPLGAAALRACAQTLTKLGLQIVPSPYTAALVGYLVSALAVWMLFRRRGPRSVRWHPRGATWFVAAGLLNGSAVLAMYGALSQTKLTVVAPIVASYPAFTILFAQGMLRAERIGIRQAAGAACVIAGMVLILA
jgi:drug/metabolite transporter (DMT)-like permease